MGFARIWRFSVRSHNWRLTCTPKARFFLPGDELSFVKEPASTFPFQSNTLYKTIPSPCLPGPAFGIGKHVGNSSRLPAREQHDEHYCASGSTHYNSWFLLSAEQPSWSSFTLHAFKIAYQPIRGNEPKVPMVTRTKIPPCQLEFRHYVAAHGCSK